MSKFDQLAGKLAHQPGVYDPKGLAAAIGRKKLGARAFNAKAQAGKKSKHHNALVAFAKRHGHG